MLDVPTIFSSASSYSIRKQFIEAWNSYHIHINNINTKVKLLHHSCTLYKSKFSTSKSTVECVLCITFLLASIYLSCHYKIAKKSTSKINQFHDFNYYHRLRSNGGFASFLQRILFQRHVVSLSHVCCFSWLLHSFGRAQADT